jgi:ATP-dependent 26S proteasome regulatory subunit
MLDLYVIATTNADNVHLDPAVLRPGRLSRKVDVNALSMERAMVCYHAIMGTKSKDGTHFDKPTTLAEVYALCREHGWSVDDVPEELTGGSVTNEEAYEDDSEYY